VGRTEKSLLVESVIFFFEVIFDDSGVERNEVIDGQQRLTTLYDYFQGRFTLVDSEDAPYISQQEQEVLRSFVE
jgi:uncharacterized protein with ParB-like and HNH nuclease domain